MTAVTVPTTAARRATHRRLLPERRQLTWTPALLIAGNLVLVALAAKGAIALAAVALIAIPAAALVLDRPPRGVIALFALVPFGGLLDAIPHPVYVDAWKEGLTLITVAGAAMQPRRVEPGRRVPDWAFALIGLLAISVISAAANGGVAAWYGLKIGFFYALVVWAVWRCPLSARDRDRLVSIFMAVGVVTALYGIGQQIIGPERLNELGYEYNTTIRTTQGFLRSFSSFPIMSAFAYYLAAAIVVGAAAALAEPARRRSRLFALATPILVLGLVSSITRAGWIGVGVGLLYLGARRHRGLLFLMPLPLLVLLFLPSGASTAALGGESGRERVAAWSDNISEVAEHPFGVGLGSSGAAAEKAELLRGVDDPDFFEPDNQYFQTLYELGPVGLWLLALLMGTAFVATRRAAAILPPRDAALADGIGAYIVGAAVISGVAGYFGVFPMDVVWWVLLAALASAVWEAPA